MAAAAITDSQRELISSLSPDDIPIKLRCANCSKLAINAFRLPCCEQAICETCHATLPSSCPVCEHSPLSADDCKVHKSLRTTVRVFLRSEEKKKDNLKLKEAKEQAEAKEVTEATPVAEATQEHVEGRDEAEAQPPVEATQGEQKGDQPFVGEDVKEGSEEAASNGVAQDGATADEKEQTTADNEVVEAHNDAAKEPPEEEDETAGDAENDAADEESKGQMGPGANAFDAANGSFPMGFGGAGDFNQMQMMFAMQNGMQPGAFGGFPMMGMPGMNMDPMAMQNMYMNMNGGYNQGMGMNMGMAGYGVGGENWNEQQQSWNSFGQDNYNHANSLGMGVGGDFGSYNSGPLQQTGFNQGNFGGHQQFYDYRRGYGFRGRGRGRGGYQDGYGRGRFQGQQNFANQAYQQYGATGATQGQEQGAADDATREPGADEHGESKANDGVKEGIADAGPGSDQLNSSAGQDPSQVINGDETQGQPRPTTATSQGESARGFAKVMSVANPDVPINAPTGPRAMRQGLPNTSVAHLRARGLLGSEERPHSRYGSADVESSAGDRRHSRSSSPRHRGSEHETYRERSREGGRENGSDEHDERSRRSRSSVSRSRSRSRSRRRKSSRRHRRDRSEDAESDDHRARRRHKSRKHSSRAGDDEDGKGRSRSVSPDDSKRSSHRSRRERDSDRRKEKHRDEDRRRRHNREDRDRARDRDRDRDRGRDRDREKERGRDRDRKERRDRDRDREKRHRSSRKHTPEPDSRVEKDKPEKLDKPTDSLRTFFPGIERMSSKAAKSKAPSERRGSQAQASNSSSGKDVHTLEREARDRERLVREAQRMAMMVGGKRGRSEDDEGRKRRRRRSEAVEGDEERLRRLEEEREGGRWG